MKVVCVVDDEPQVRKSLANLLRSAGYQAVCFASGEGFLASEWCSRAMALVLDLHMPGLQGVDVQCRLKEAGFSLPVICMSANNSREVAQQALQDGARAFLAKPFSAEALLTLLASLSGAEA
ncbi:response regulator [Pseudomonas sp. AA-38]|uniref:response regulator transcription factor n=1 Tax=Pseudomonas sp. AA-38 TaxID=3028807 RepID=UPI0023F76AA2|nr:response regulator [Pseudomonas sp. AA-38]